MNNFFKHNDKVYSENLNDSVLVGNAFSWSISIDLPTDSEGLFPTGSDVVKAKVADVYATPNSNLSIGDTISNTSGSSQVYRLTVYPNFNRFGGFTFVELVGDGSVIITEKGGTSPVRNNLDYSNLGNVTELKTLKEYDLVVTIPSGGVVTGLSFGFQSSTASADASISQANVSGLVDDLSSLRNGKADKLHYQVDHTVNLVDAMPNIGVTGGSTLREAHNKIDEAFGSLSTSITNLADTTSWTTYFESSDYTVRYNDYRVNVDISITGTSATTSLTSYGANIIPDSEPNLRPKFPVSAFSHDGNVLVQIKNNDNKLYRKSMTGSSLSNISIYAHLEWDRR